MKSFKQFHEEREELDEGSASKAVDYFLSFHRKNKDKPMHRNLWTVSRMVGMKYRQLENELNKQLARQMIPKDLEPEIKKLLRIK